MAAAPRNPQLLSLMESNPMTLIWKGEYPNYTELHLVQTD